MEFIAEDGRLWLFREFSQLEEFLTSDTWPAPYWRDLLEVDDQALVPDSAKRYNLFQGHNGSLTRRDSPGSCGSGASPALSIQAPDVALPCTRSNQAARVEQTWQPPLH
ncbi:hypothetical protein ACH4E7_37250 [Kitasatospora sp. NPDC018058]|uniref:hypothetical protein n=1 Tax=Kitasatospora sp. NPDC018058 TaxID=3364025 RepID=UPI0037BF29A5